MDAEGKREGKGKITYEMADITMRPSRVTNSTARGCTSGMMGKDCSRDCSKAHRLSMRMASPCSKTMAIRDRGMARWMRTISEEARER